MKKIVSLILALVLCLSLSACGGGTTTEPLTAREQLTDLEEKLFNHILAITKKYSVEPSSVRVLEVCDYHERSKYEATADESGPDTVVVCLQGENKVGGTVNDYVKICIKAGENKSEWGQIVIDLQSGSGGDKEILMNYKAKEGEFVILDSYKPKTDSSDLFNVGRINKALKEYWEEMGF